MSQEGMFVVVLTVQRGTGRLMTSPDIISRGFIYLRDSEELMGMIRQYLKQKAARSFSGKYDLDVIKKEIKDEITHILYDQTRRTPIVIPVVNEIGGGASKSNGNGNAAGGNNGQSKQSRPAGRSAMPRPSGKKFPPRQIPDTEATVPRNQSDTPNY